MRVFAWMRFLFCVATLGCVFSHEAIAADEDAIVELLTALGGQATLAGSTATKIVFRDSSKLGDIQFQEIGQLTRLKSLTLYNKCHELTDKTLPHLTVAVPALPSSRALRTFRRVLETARLEWYRSMQCR